MYINTNSGFGTQSEYKQKQVEALTLVKSMKLEAHPIASGVGGWVVHSEFPTYQDAMDKSLFLGLERLP